MGDGAREKQRGFSHLPSSIRHLPSVMNAPRAVQRCAWAGHDRLMQTYHDEEWGVPEHDPRALWEKLMLDGFQAGLAWITVLRKRDAFRAAFAGFEPATVARFSEKDIQRLLADAGIIRSRANIESTITGARIYGEMQ